MSAISRREFLKAVTASLGAAAVSACTPQVLSKTNTPAPSIQKTFPPELSPLQPSPQATDEPSTSPTESGYSPTSQSEPYIVVARNGEPEEMVRRALSALGGIERFVAPGSKVIIKPNICVAYHTYEYAATTNPWVVGALVKLCLEVGASQVSVLDYPFGGTPDQAYAVSGIADQVVAAGGQMVVMPRFKFIETDITNGKSLKKAAIFEDALKADVLINVPIAKNHSLARLTLGMKNMMGLIQNREAIHADMGQRLADLAGHIKPTLTIIDAVRILMAHGPTGGNLADVKQMDTIIASPDIVAADSFAATLFGLAPDDISYIKAGTERGLGRSDLENLKIEEINLGA